MGSLYSHLLLYCRYVLRASTASRRILGLSSPIESSLIGVRTDRLDCEIRLIPVQLSTPLLELA
jgi:hypothetical protein